MKKLQKSRPFIQHTYIPASTMISLNKIVLVNSNPLSLIIKNKCPLFHTLGQELNIYLHF